MFWKGNKKDSMLSLLFLTVSRIIIPSLKSIDQSLIAQIFVTEGWTVIIKRFTFKTKTSKVFKILLSAPQIKYLVLTKYKSV